MKNYNKAINILVIGIILLSICSCAAGLLLKGGMGEYEFKSIHGEVIKIYGSGLYKNDSLSAVSQGKASDLITLILGVPLLIFSLCFTLKGSFRGKLVLTGTLGYFLYTFMSYTFLWNYNPLFIVYVILMSCSIYAFILCLLSFDINKMPQMFREQLPVRFLGIFQIFIGFAIGMLWLGKLAPTITNGDVPVGLEHYTTLVIQGMDLGIVVPTAILSGILLMKHKPFGYLLSSVIILKSITMLTSISAMIINQAINGVEMNVAEILIFPLFNILALISMVLLMKNIAPQPLSRSLVKPC